LKRELEDVAREIVGIKGVDVNNDVGSLLEYVPGMSKGVVKKLLEYRKSNVLRERKDLNKVPGIGKKVFEIVNGYCKTGRVGLEETLIGCGDYDVAERVLKRIGFKGKLEAGWKEKVAVLGGVREWEWKEEEEAVFNLLMEACVAKKVVEELGGAALEDEVKKDWKKMTGKEMNVRGVVSNVTDFGCFVDLGTKRQGLVHVSKGKGGAGVGVGSSVVVDVLSVDKERGRIELTWSDGRGEKRKEEGGGGGGGKRRK